jgi:hypothetical protein
MIKFTPVIHPFPLGIKGGPRNDLIPLGFPSDLWMIKFTPLIHTYIHPFPIGDEIFSRGRPRK